MAAKSKALKSDRIWVPHPACALTVRCCMKWSKIGMRSILIGFQGRSQATRFFTSLREWALESGPHFL